LVWWNGNYSETTFFSPWNYQYNPNLRNHIQLVQIFMSNRIRSNDSSKVCMKSSFRKQVEATPSIELSFLTWLLVPFPYMFYQRSKIQEVWSLIFIMKKSNKEEFYMNSIIPVLVYMSCSQSVGCTWHWICSCKYI